MRLGRALKIAGVTVVLLAVGLVAIAVGVLMFGGAPMKNGASLADGKVTLVLEWMGPVRIGAYILDLADGGFALVDCGPGSRRQGDPVRPETARRGRRRCPGGGDASAFVPSIVADRLREKFKS